MATVFLHESLAYRAAILRRYRELYHTLGLDYTDVRVCRRRPRAITPADFLLWPGEAAPPPALPPEATGFIRSRRTGAFGYVLGRAPADCWLLLNRWDEVETAGGHAFFTDSVAEHERDTGDLRWVLDRLIQCHSHSYGRSVDWEALERQARRRLDAAGDAQDHLRAWQWLFARLHDGHTKLLGIEGPHACPMVHCGVYGRFLDRGRFLVEEVRPSSAAEDCRLAAGDEIVAVNGLDWPTFLRRETAFWAFSSSHCRRAARPFLPWYQPAGTCLRLATSAGTRMLAFGEESYAGFFHWLCRGKPDPVTFDRLGPGRYRLRIAYFPSDDDFVPRCREALASLPADAHLELDLRGNGGGSGEFSCQVVSMLLPRGSGLYRARVRRVGGGFGRWVVERSTDEPVFLGPVTVLMDELCASATEGFIGALKSAGRARLVGRRTAGSSGLARVFLSRAGVRFSCSSWQETTPEGEPIEGRGVTTRPWKRPRRS